MIILRILNCEFTLRKRFNLSSYLFTFIDRYTSNSVIEYNPPVEEPWEYRAPIEKRLRTMAEQMLPYAFRDCGLMMVQFPDEAIPTFDGILSFVDMFRNDMISKGAADKDIEVFDKEVEGHIFKTMIQLQQQDPVVFNIVIEFYNKRIEEADNDKRDKMS